MIRVFCLRPRLCEEKLSQVEGSLAYPSYPGRATISYISLRNVWNRLQEKESWLGLNGDPLEESPFCDGSEGLLAGSTIQHIDTLSRSAGPSFPGDFPPYIWGLTMRWPRGYSPAIAIELFMKERQSYLQ